jgi:hypothetical protein
MALSIVPCPKCGKMNHSPPLDPLYPLEFDTWPTCTITPDCNGLITMTLLLSGGQPEQTDGKQPLAVTKQTRSQEIRKEEIMKLNPGK